MFCGKYFACFFSLFTHFHCRLSSVAVSIPFYFMCCHVMRFVKLTCPPFCGVCPKREHDTMRIELNVCSCPLPQQHTHAHTYDNIFSVCMCVVSGLANKLIFHIFFGKTLHELYIKVIMWSSLYECVCVCLAVCLGRPRTTISKTKANNEQKPERQKPTSWKF